MTSAHAAPAELDPSVRGHQAAGPKRWQRAAQWAAARPHTKAAQLYLARLEGAEAAAQALGEAATGGWEHHRKLHWRGPGYGYKHQTCSAEHAFLQFHLDALPSGTAGLEALHEYVTREDPEWVLVRRPADSKRRGRCAVCGGAVT